MPRYRGWKCFLVWQEATYSWYVCAGVGTPWSTNTLPKFSIGTLSNRPSLAIRPEITVIPVLVESAKKVLIQTCTHVHPPSKFTQGQKKIAAIILFPIWHNSVPQHLHSFICKKTYSQFWNFPEKMQNIRNHLNIINRQWKLYRT